MLDAAVLNMVVNAAFALAALTTAGVGVLNYLETRRNGRAALAGRAAITDKVQGVSKQVAAVDIKADGMLEQTNGHLTQLIAAVRPLDPEAAEVAAKKIEDTAEKVALKLAENQSGGK